MKIFCFMKWALLASIIYMCSSPSFGQNTKPDNPFAGKPFKERAVFGGDFGLSFGSITFIRLAPIMGYRVNEKLTIGGGPSYQYFSDNRFTPRFTQSIYGLSTFAQYVAFNNIFLQVQPEILNVEDRFASLGPSGEIIYDRVFIPVLFVGGGLAQMNSRGTGVFISVLYDIVQDPNSPYPGNLVFRVGGFFGF